MNDSRLDALGQFSRTADRIKTTNQTCVDPLHCTTTQSWNDDETTEDLLHQFCQRMDGIYWELSLSARCTGLPTSSGGVRDKEIQFWNKPVCIPVEKAESCPGPYKMIDAWRWYEFFEAAV